jgi:hypothetical protein
VLALVMTTGAFAWWASAGTGSGSAANGTPSALTITAQSPSQSLLPTGAATGDVQLTIANPNSYSVHVNQLALNPAQGIAGFSANATGCALSFATQNNAGAGWTIAPGSTSVSLPSSVTMGTAAASICQGATFDIYLAAS